MGFDIGRFQREYKKMAAENRELKDKLVHAEQEKAQAIAGAIILARKPLEEHVDHLKREHHAKDKRLADMANTNETLSGLLAARERELGQAHDQLAAVRADRHHLLGKVRDAEPTLQAERDKVAALQALLDRVGDRMRRKEVEEKNAILNRQAMGNVAPAVNRRG